MTPNYLLKFYKLAPLQFITTAQINGAKQMIDTNTIIKYVGIGFLLVMAIVIVVV